jgi:hypothetical protein
MRHAKFLAPVLLAIAAAALADSPPVAPPSLSSAPAPAGAEVYIISPRDGETVQGPVTVRFGLKGMGVAPAGIQVANTGHHHLLVDAVGAPQDQPIGKDDQHLHFGGGQTETVLELKPGKHTLQLVLGDYLHVPFKPSIETKPITITVK